MYWRDKRGCGVNVLVRHIDPIQKTAHGKDGGDDDTRNERCANEIENHHQVVD